MFTHSFKLGTAFNIPIFAHWSMLLAVGSAIFSFGLVGIVLACFTFCSIIAHEYAHSLIARRYGFKTSRITLHYFGGAASVDLTNAKPKQEAVIAIAGPAISGIIAAAALLADLTIKALSYNQILILDIPILTALGIINAIVAAFNMLPIFPMDGGRILRAALQLRFGRARAMQIALNISVALASALVVLAILKVHALLTMSMVILVISFLLKVGHKDADLDEQMP